MDRGNTMDSFTHSKARWMSERAAKPNRLHTRRDQEQGNFQNEASKMRMEAWKIRDRTYAVKVKRRSADLLQLGLETAGAVLRRNA
jgi:hypothetical protein